MTTHARTYFMASWIHELLFGELATVSAFWRVLIEDSFKKVELVVGLEVQGKLRIWHL